MANVIIGIHGLANKPEPRLLAHWWEKSIKEGLKNRGVDNADFKFVMVYWADLLYKFPQHDDANFEHDPSYLNQPYAPAAAGALKEYERGDKDEARKAVASGLSKVKKLFDKSPLATLEDRFTEWLGKSPLAALEDQLIAAKGWELALYNDENSTLGVKNGQNQSARKVLMGKLTNAIREHAGNRLMLISHSMGTIIAYDVLRNLGKVAPNFQVAQFVTMGSPLGIKVVKERIRKEYADVRTPSVVKGRWTNYADPLDIVAVKGTLEDDYDPNDAKIQVEDIPVQNDYTAPDGKRKPHKSFGYLRTPEISDQIKDFLQG